jgi:hypothetical protein
MKIIPYIVFEQIVKYVSRFETFPCFGKENYVSYQQSLKELKNYIEGVNELNKLIKKLKLENLYVCNL